MSSGADTSDLNTFADVATTTWQAEPARRAIGQSAPGALARLRAVGDTAQAVGAALSLRADELAASEAFDRLERFIARSVEQAAALNPEDMRGWFEALGDDLELDLTLEGLDSALEPVSAELRATDDPAGTLARFQQAALVVAETQGDSVNVGVQLRIGKRLAQRLAEQALRERRPDAQRGATVAAAPEAALVFYHMAACERMLTLSAAPVWKQRGLGGDETRLCVIICDGTGYLAGPALEVIGATREAHETDVADAEWLPMSRAAWRRFVARTAALRRLRETESAWSGLTLALMPDHLHVVARAPGLARIATRLQCVRAQVAACSLASHVARVERADVRSMSSVAGVAGEGEAMPGDLILRYAGARPAVARLASAAPPADLEAPPRDALIALAEWAYRDASPDKLAIARQALADTLPAGATLTLAQLTVAAAPALDAARANFAIYLKGATERYFQLRATAQQTVSGFAEATRTAVASLTSDVTENLFRTVGLIVGVIIAWLIEPSASLTLVRVAAALYTIYVSFIVLYLLRARQDRYQLERKGLDDALAAMDELTQTERERLRKPAAAAEAHFERYYRLTRRIYFALIGLGALVFLLMFTPLPQMVIPHIVR